MGFEVTQLVRGSLGTKSQGPVIPFRALSSRRTEDCYTVSEVREDGQVRADHAISQKITNAEVWLGKAIGLVTGETLFLLATEHGSNSTIIQSHLLQI